MLKFSVKKTSTEELTGQFEVFCTTFLTISPGYVTCTLVVTGCSMNVDSLCDKKLQNI